MEQKHYIEDLENFEGTLEQLKLVVDYLVTNYGNTTLIGMDRCEENTSFSIFMGAIH
jgi:hypothetical protein